MMRPIAETKERWQETKKHSSSLAVLRRAVLDNDLSSPCLSGCRSVCWKAFLVFKDTPVSDWQKVLRETRTDYAEHRDRLLRFIKHPEELAKLAVDPLADDPNSPWDTVRQDEVARAEIQQDVRRLPEEANYQEQHIQTMILDILFVYCKTNPGEGGYRQGMHELLAPMVHVIEQDALDRSRPGRDSSMDPVMLDVLDAAYVEHDAYTLFSRLMDHAQVFYQVKEPTLQSRNPAEAARMLDQSSAIVERSRCIHEVYLQKVDPELAVHLTAVQILPQVFLIRWIRLLFSREFPLAQCLLLWDTIFAVDPTLEAIDLICVAMLVRIRWSLLEADYSSCLPLLLKYPPPQEPHGPQTLVYDAIFLQSHMNASGGASLAMKYTGKMPAATRSPDEGRPSTPNIRAFTNLGQLSLGAKSPTRFIQQSGGMEALFQGATKGAKGVFEKGEKLGINQAVREAMGEIRKNMQSFNEAKFVSTARRVTDDEVATMTLAAMEKRNKQLANMLEETVANLKSISTSRLEDKARSLERIEVASAKVQFVQMHLEDSTLELTAPELPKDGQLDRSPEAGSDREQGGKGRHTPDPTLLSPPLASNSAAMVLTDPPRLDKAVEAASSPEAGKTNVGISPDSKASAALAGIDRGGRPAAVPTRSTLAQSSFSWMLEPDEPKPSPASSDKSPPMQPKKRSSKSASRGKNAFLFGEATAEDTGPGSLTSENIFGMQPLQRAGHK